MKPILLSGIQPTGRLHLGNYLGALKNFVALQNSGKYQCYFFIADLHALTKEFGQKELADNIHNVMLSFFAAGLNPKKSILFFQSQIPAHTELTWILNALTPMGELERMTQFKDKAGVSKNFFEMLSVLKNVDALFKEKLKPGVPLETTEIRKELARAIGYSDAAQTARESSIVGLFDYPVLMASDILLYDTKFVPVGEDQDQHLELTRTLARKFNNKFGKTFIEPRGLHAEIPRLMSLDDATKKMSKSRPAGCLFLDDSPETIREKIKRAQTDSGREIKYDPKNKAAISNLILIYAGLTEKSISKIEHKFENTNYSEFKKDLAEVIVKVLKPFRENKLSNAAAQGILKTGTKKANIVASKKLLEVKKKIGLIL